MKIPIPTIAPASRRQGEGRRTAFPLGVFLTLGFLLYAAADPASEQCPNCGGGSGTDTYTNSTTHHTTYTRTDLPPVNQYQTRVIARYSSGKVVYDKTLLAPSGDPTVQAAFKDARAALVQGRRVVISGPKLVSSNTSSRTDYLGTQLDHTQQTVTATNTAGPATIHTGLDQSQCCTVPDGTVNHNTNTHIETFLKSVYQTTNTASQHYELVGTLAGV